jgi:hypothetical protein
MSLRENQSFKRKATLLGRARFPGFRLFKILPERHKISPYNLCSSRDCGSYDFPCNNRCLTSRTNQFMEGLARVLRGDCHQAPAFHTIVDRPSLGSFHFHPFRFLLCLNGHEWIVLPVGLPSDKRSKLSSLFSSPGRPEPGVDDGEDKYKQLLRSPRSEFFPDSLCNYFFDILSVSSMACTYAFISGREPFSFRTACLRSMPPITGGLL